MENIQLIESVLPLLVIGYLIGSIPVAYLAVKWRYKVDIRQYGSHQVGGSNVFRSFSKPLGAAVFLFDAGKGALLVWIADSLGLATALQVCIGVAVIIGHNWPVFLHFNAGRGLATSIGISLYLLPLGFPPFLFIALFTLIIGSSPLPLLLAMATFPLTSWALGKPLILTLGLTALYLLMIIRRLTAPRVIGTEAVSNRELLLNRLLFDRDTRDESKWVNFKPE